MSNCSCDCHDREEDYGEYLREQEAEMWNSQEEREEIEREAREQALKDVCELADALSVTGFRKYVEMLNYMTPEEIAKRAE